MAACQMAQGHGSVHLGHRTDQPHKHRHHRQNRQSVGVGGHGPQHFPHLGQVVEEALITGNDQYTDNRHQDAEHGDHHGADELGGHQLPGLDGNGEHEVALILQQALIKPGNDDHRGHHHHRHNQQHIQQHHQGVDQTQALLGIQASTRKQAVDPGHHQQHAPQGQENLEHGFEVIFQQFSQHSSHLPEDWPGTCPGTRRPRSCPPGPGCRLRPRGPTPGPAGGTPPRPAPAPRLQ